MLQSNNNLLIIFTLLTIGNVIFSTIKSIITIKGSPLAASVASGLYYSFYSAVLLYSVADFPLWQKMAITLLCNLMGVYIVKKGEQKARKDRLWKVELTIPTKYLNAVDRDLKEVPHSYITLSDKHTLFNFYCATQAESQKVKDIVNQYDAKYFVAESQEL